MKFLIIGASGFIGRHTLDYVKSLGYEVVGTQSNSKYPNLITFNLLKHRIKECIKPSFFEKSESIFGIICSAISKIDLCFKEKKLSRTVNIEKTITLIKDLVSLGVKPVFLSSTAVFDGKLGHYNEKHSPAPICEYGRQKAEVEEFILNNYPDALVLRLDKVIGDDPVDNKMFSEWYQLIKANKPIVCINGNLLSPTYVKDVAGAIVLSCQKGLSGLYHVANSESFTREELARQFVSALGRKAKVISKPLDYFKFADPRPLKTYLDSTKFVKATGMKFTSMNAVFNNFIKKL